MRAWIDPATPTSLATYLELRRLTADRSGTLRIEIRLARGANQRQPPQDRIRTWTIALAAHGHLEPALRELARDGASRLIARLGTEATRAKLAADMGVPAPLHERLATDTCARSRLEANTAQLLSHYDDKPSSVRPPVFEIGGHVLDDTSTLGRVRPSLGLDGLRRDDRPTPPTVAAPVEASQPRMRHPKIGGIVLGGPGLPHRFVIQARDEHDASLFMRLPTVLRIRREHPGRLAVHVVARGSSLRASGLRHRLCAARILGQELSYLEVLASDPTVHEHPPPDVVALLKALDKVPERRCEDDPDPAQLDLPDGQWLDGLPRSRAELVNLEIALRRTQEAAYRPLTPWLGSTTGR